MRLCLAFLFQNDLHWLRLHLPTLLSADCFDGVVGLDGGSTDGSAAYLRELDVTVYERPFEWDFAAQVNALIDHCEQDGYTHLLRTDPDELWHPGELVSLRAMGAHDALAFRRYNFVRDRRHVAPAWYPDWQTRFWKLHAGIRLHRAVDEVMIGGASTLHPSMHIYHYGCITPFRMKYTQFVNYDRVRAGLPPLHTHVEPDVPDGYPDGVSFSRPQPLNPMVIGLYAPFENTEWSNV